LLYYDEALGWPELTGIALALAGVTMVIQKGIAPAAQISPLSRAGVSQKD